MPRRTPYDPLRRSGEGQDATRLLLGRLLAERVRRRGAVEELADVEFRVFSQFGDDGIIQYLVGRLDGVPRTFIEFGVEDYRESNTRFLLINDDWRGFIMDGSESNIRRVRGARWSRDHDLRAEAAFVDRDNINSLLAGSGLGRDVGILHIDIDGNDYWVWESIHVVEPVLAIIEYNSVFGSDRAISVPYDPAFRRDAAHPSHLYFGASLPALCHLADRKGYAFVGSNSAGNNAYFVRRDRLGVLRERTPADGWVESRFRESRDEQGRLSYLSGPARLEAIRGLPVVDVTTGRTEPL